MSQSECFAVRRRVLGAAVCLACVLLVAPAASGQPDGPGRLVNVDGHRLFIQCMGSGSPTVMIDGGAGTWSLFYRHIQQELAATARVCTYDRAGLGRSEAGPKPRTSLQMAAELHTLLHNAGITPPVILVGHSLGGLNVRVYQQQYPEEVAAVVLLDSAHENQWERLPQVVREVVAGAPPTFRQVATMAREGKLNKESVARDVIRIGSEETRAEHAAALLTPKPYEGRADEMESVFASMSGFRSDKSLANVPLVVLTARDSFAAFAGTPIPVPEANRAWLKMQEELAALSKRSTHLFSEHDHNLHETDPAAVVNAISVAVKQVRQAPAAVAALGLPPLLPDHSEPAVDALLSRMEAAYNAMDADAFTALFTDDVTQLDVNRRVHIKGRAEWNQWTRLVNAAHSAMTRRHRGRARVGDFIVVEIEWSGTVRGAAVNAPADRNYRYTGLGLLRLREGKVQQQILYGDYASLMEQLRGARAD